jgi:Carbohydrate-selective porin, OprB family
MSGDVSRRAVNIRTRWFPSVLTTCAAIAHADVRNPVAELGVRRRIALHRTFCAAHSGCDRLGVGRTHVNGRVAVAESLSDAVRPEGLPVQTSEYVGEMFYSLHIAQWLQLRPDVQYVLRPGGNPRTTDDVIVALRLSINL